MEHARKHRSGLILSKIVEVLFPIILQKVFFFSSQQSIYWHYIRLLTSHLFGKIIQRLNLRYLGELLDKAFLLVDGRGYVIGLDVIFLLRRYILAKLGRLRMLLT
jgi:hypothetical protein